jgi:adenylosuccinate lyase
VKLTGAKNDLLERIAADKTFGLTEEELRAVIDPAKFTGMAVQQTEIFLREQVQPVLDANRELLGTKDSVTV